MASPFAVFRRNQKILLATAGIMAIVAFVFFDPLARYLSGGRKQQNPIVVETNFGDLTRNELENLKFSRELVDRFLQRVTVHVVTAQMGGNIDPRWVDTFATRRYMDLRYNLMGPSPPRSDEAAIETLVLAKRAEQMGMVISDQAINDLLKEITAESISRDELETIIQNLQSRPVSVARLFGAIRTEMMASEYRKLFELSVRDVPPAQRFGYYARLNRRANAEVMALVVADFVGQVADPASEQVQQFYEKYKNDYPNPDSPEPGFKEPPRATFQYFKASIDQLTEKIKPEITDEEIKKYYEDNKAQFRVFEFEKEPGDQPDSGEGEAKPEPDAEGSKESPDDAKPEGESKEEPGDEPKADEPAPSEKADSEKPETEKPETEEPAGEKPAAPEAPKTDDNPDESSPQAGAPARRVVRFASATLSAEEPAAGAQPADKAKPKDDADKDQPGKDDADNKPADETPSEEKPSEEKPSDEKPSEEKPADEKPAGQDEGGEGSPAPKEEPDEPPRFEPLEKVADTIRETLARQRASERISEQFDELLAAMRRYTDELDLYITEKSTRPSAKPPAPLDFTKLAEGKDVEAAELVSVSAAEAAKTDIGKSFRVVQDPRTQMANTIPFVDFAFSETLPTHKPETVQDGDNNLYLFWKTEEERAYVPPLDQIRNRVVEAWKTVKARQLARKRADEYATQARALKKPLKELFANQANLKITDTGPFSWLTLGNVPAGSGGPPRLSDVEGVDRPGPAFMKAVFDLDVGGIGVADNEPQNLVYVIRVVEFEPPADQLRDDFARENPNRYMAAAVDDQRAIYQAWLADLNEQAGVHWISQNEAPRNEEAGF